MKSLILAVCFVVVGSGNLLAEVIFESATLGPTGIQISDVTSGIVESTTVDEFFYPGVRVFLNQSVEVTSLRGHFIRQAGSSDMFFGAIIALDNNTDFPDSEDLSTNDVVGSTLLQFQDASSVASGDLSSSLEPGWYGIVFGSGLFGSPESNLGAALRNNVDMGDQSYFALGPNLGWFNFEGQFGQFKNHYFALLGDRIPEPGSLTLIGLAGSLCLPIRHRKSHSQCM